MDRNPVLQDLHTFHNPASSTGTNYQDKMTDNMFVMSNNSTISNASDTQSTASFLDALDFTNFDSKFYQPPVQEQQIQHQQSQPQQQQQQQQQQNQNQAQSQHQNQNQNQNINQNINQNQRLQELQSYANQLQLNRQQFHDIQQQQQQQQHHQQQQYQQQQQQQQQTQQQQHIHHQHQPQQHHHSQQVYSPNAYYQQQQLHHLQQQQQHQQQYLPVYAGTPQQQQQQHNQILLQRFNSNGSTTSSTNSQPSYISNYSPMAHYSQSLQQQEQAGVNKIYFSNNDYQQQQIQVPVSLTKKRKINVGGTELLEETLSVQKKKTKAKKKKVPKVVDPNAPPKPKRKTGLNKPLILSDALSELMDGDKELSRPELVQKLWKYIKSNDLQDPADRRFILCDAKLKKIFDQDRINSFGMNKDLSAHLTKKEEPIITQVTIETSESVTKDIVQQEPTPSEDNNTNEDDFLL